MNNAKIIWDILIANGCTEAGAAGVIGNMDEESSLIPYRRQGDMNASNGYAVSVAYTDRVDRGRVTRDEFAHNGPGGGGYGLCQWTYFTRKYDLYEFAKSKGVSIGDLVMQAEFFCKECKERYADVWKVITTTKDVQTASDSVLLRYERPSNMYEKRAKRGATSKKFYDQLVIPDEDAPVVENEYWPPRMIQYGMEGPDVKVAQALLEVRGYPMKDETYGSFGYYTKEGVISEQKKNGLNADGIIGDKTWPVLLGR